MINDWYEIREQNVFDEFIYNNRNILVDNCMIYNFKFLNNSSWYMSNSYLRDKL